MIIFAAGICQKSGAAEICRANAAAEICRKKQRLRYIVVMILATGICPKIAAAEICQAHVAAEIIVVDQLMLNLGLHACLKSDNERSRFLRSGPVL